jgi:hypothetical protein
MPWLAFLLVHIAHDLERLEDLRVERQVEERMRQWRLKNPTL